MIKKSYQRFIVAPVAFLVTGLLPFIAFAQGGAPADSKALITKLAGESAAGPQLIAVVCYVVGVFYTLRALFALKNYITNADENPINSFLSYGAIGSLLLFTPYSIALVAQSLGMRFPTVISSQDTFEDETGFKGYHFSDQDSGSTTSLEAVFSSLSVEFIPLSKTIAVFAYVIAAVILLVGLLHLKNYGDDPSQVPIRSIMIKFVLASMLISLPFAMQIFVTTVTGKSTIETQDTVGKPCLMNGSGLAAIRGGSSNTTGGCM